jgi:alkaline phosphatase D
MVAPKDGHQVGRRSFIKGAAGGLLGAAMAGSPSASASAEAMAGPRRSVSERGQDPPAFLQAPTVSDLQPVQPLPPGITRTWLGPAFWANRLQDWELANGRIKCLRGGASYEVRTVAVLTREVIDGAQPGALAVRAGLIEDEGGGGFCGFLVGAGAGMLDYRAAALVQRASGTGGGLLCTYETDGRVRFREHTDEEHPLAFGQIPADETYPAGAPPRPGVGQEVLLRLEMLPNVGGRFRVVLTAWDAGSGRFLAGAVRLNVEEQALVGGIALVSSPRTGAAGARYFFRDLQTGGGKIAVRPERALGPIVGVLYSLNDRVLKLSAQLVPIGSEDPQPMRLQHRTAGGAWQDGPLATVGAGFSALFRLEGWDSTREHEYRVVYPADVPDAARYSGRIARDPAGSAPLSIGLVSCTIAAARSLEGGGPRAELPAAEPLGRYTHKNVYFPHRELATHLAAHRPDLLVFAGDQYYEGNPTRAERDPSPTLDYLYKWFLWIWSFRELTRDRPAIVMVDDHDVYHGNLWGNGGRSAPERDQNRGGYRNTAEWVNIVQRTQCGHNPDPFDPAPVDQGITVYYGSFHYGGVSFAILEDRKFKTAPMQGEDLNVHVAELLGERQERFLDAWARDGASMPKTPKICLTQSIFGCLQTSPDGRPLLDFDANGYPKLGRDRAVDLLRRARALVLAGDQHLGSLVRHGLDSFTDGVLQFTGPAGGSSWQRWFAPVKPLPNVGHQPHTGDFIDAFGNKMRVLAVANPRISFAEYRQYIKGRGQGLGDRRLKREGYGVVRVDLQKREYLLECWPWDVDPTAADARQFEGWPYRLSFDDV